MLVRVQPPRHLAGVAQRLVHQFAILGMWFRLPSSAHMQGCGEARHVVRPAPCGCSITVIT